MSFNGTYANLLFLSLLVFFVFVLSLQNVLGRDKKDKLEHDMSTKPTDLFCFSGIVSIIPEGLPLSSAHQAE